MEPENIRFGGGATDTILHPLVAVWMLVAVVLILTLPRNKAIVPFLLACFTIPLGQVLLVGGLHFPVLRILILTGLARRGILDTSLEKFPEGFNALDRAIVLWTVSGFVITCLQWMNTQATIKFTGDLIDILGGFLVVRSFITDVEAVRRTMKVLAVVCVILGTCMVYEKINLVNVFGYLGGIGISPEFRAGRVRANGVMGQIQGGAFGGVLIPLFVWLRTQPQSRLAAYAGLVGASAMVYASGASTSAMAYGGSLLSLAFWPMRKQMRFVRWTFVITLIVLHLVMNGPVWSLIAKVDVTGGSSSYHRYMLIDTLIRHFNEWCLIGTRNNGSWGWEMWDTCNQFVATAVTGGLLTLVFYIMILKNSFAMLGNARKQVSGDRGQEWTLWCFGSCLFANIVAQIGINYMLQLLLLLFPLLACISVTVSEIRRSEPAQTVVPEGESLALQPASF
jgi:hypothetical protein